MDQRSFASPEDYAIDPSPSDIQRIKAAPGVTHVQRIASKMGVLKTDEDFLPVQLKGYGSDYDSTFIKKSLLRGHLPKDNEILISESEAKELRLDVGSRVFAYFFQDDIRMRRFTVSGVYETHMPLFDKNMVFADFQTVATLNGWTEERPDACSSIEIFYDEEKYDWEYMRKSIIDSSPAIASSPTVKIMHISELYPQVFSWLSVLNKNIVFIFIIMILVSGITMVSGLLILILERTQAIGVLKALGASNGKIRRTFLYFASMIVVRGMILGNLLAFAIILAQQYFGLVKLAPATYYVETVPMEILPLPFLLINLGSLVITILALIVPSMLISHIQPAKSIKFE